jgi:signal transduction histidine kinase
MIAGISIAVILSLSMVGFLSYTQRQAALQSFIEQEETLTQFTIANIELSLTANRIEEIEKTINRLSTYSIFQGILISDPGAVLTIHRPTSFTPPPDLVIEKGKPAMHKGISYKRYDLTDTDGEIFGDVVIAFTRAPVETAVRQMFLRTLGIGLLILLPLFIVLSYQVTRITRLHQKSDLAAFAAIASELRAVAEREKAAALEIEIAMRVQVENALREKTVEISRSHVEMEQFAYVASHDLQEPLRKISGFARLLSEDYQGQLGKEADLYFGYMMAGATQMQNLINDLLAYARVGKQAKPFCPCDCTIILNEALSNLDHTITETRAVITHDPLPSVWGDPVQLHELFLNLIGNAIKYRGRENPNVHIRVTESENAQHFFVRDNGIGIDPKQSQKIFVIFQRLHTRDEYPGSGIGLSICKKIVENHGGKIWVDSQIGQGATFHFTLAKKTAA